MEKTINEKAAILEKTFEFKDVRVYETWFESINELEQEIDRMRSYLKKVKRERKLQPTIQTYNKNRVDIKKPPYQVFFKNNKLHFLGD